MDRVEEDFCGGCGYDRELCSCKPCKERPILFSAPMVRAILAGTKTQTRRVVKSPHLDLLGRLEREYGKPIDSNEHGVSFDADGVRAVVSVPLRCPYGAPGDRLWVRETHVYRDKHERVYYRADHGDTDPYAHNGWRPSIFMPRKWSRITLEVTGVRVERVKSISKENAIAEGARFTDYGMHENQVSIDGGKTYGIHRQQRAGWSLVETTSHEQCLGSPQAAFGNLWIAINGEDSWDANPWVWVVEFSRISP